MLDTNSCRFIITNDGKGPDALLRLVDRFGSDRKVFQSPDHKEEQLRLEFLNPFFTALGWDMDDVIDTSGAGGYEGIAPLTLLSTRTKEPR